jgi:hypothetical protein
MVRYMNLEEQVDADFSRARRKALLRRISTRLRRDNASNPLLCFDDLRKIPGASARVYRGTRTVLVSQIGGSVGRCSEFDGDFMPAKASAEERWKHIDRAFHRGEELPPVSLYKVGGFYFVLDGHHRLSVASYHGVEWIDAEVTEFGARPSKARGQADEQPERGEAKMYQWLPPQLLKDIHDQAVRDAQQAARKRRVGRAGICVHADLHPLIGLSGDAAPPGWAVGSLADAASGGCALRYQRGEAKGKGTPRWYA